MTAARPPRDASLDSLRGTDVLLMIIVNVQGSSDAAYPLLRHAEWNGMTFADLVFPVFLLVVGLSVPLAFDRPGVGVSWPAILRRTMLLFLIGVGLSWLIRPTIDLDMVRWTGVLQRIAIVYLVCAVVVVMRRGATLAAALAALLLALHAVLLLRVGAPTGGGPSMAPGMGLSGWLDQTFIPGRVLRGTWEPEGILSTLSAIANGLIGVAIMRVLQRRGGGAARLAMIGAALAVAGLALTPALPLNKNLWTPSFALVTCGVGMLAWALLRAAFARFGGNRILQWTAGLGQAALTLYVVHTLLIAVIVRTLPGGERVWDATYGALVDVGLPPAFASLLYAGIAAAISCAILPWLKRRGWVLKV